MYKYLSALSYTFFFSSSAPHRHLHSFPTRRSSDLSTTPSGWCGARRATSAATHSPRPGSWGSRTARRAMRCGPPHVGRSEEHTSELQSLRHLVCRLLLEKKKNKNKIQSNPIA